MKKQRNSLERAHMLEKRRRRQDGRDGPSPPQKASHGRANLPGGTRRRLARQAGRA